jgi:quinol monooxygenase YgiN
MIVITATFKAKAGQEQELEAAIQALVPNVQNEEGTLVYTVHKAKADPAQFFFYEMYRDKAALDFHGSTPYFKEFSGKIAGLLEAKPQIAMFEDIASISR